MPEDSFTTRREDRATRLLVPLGVMIVMAATAALIVAGADVADTFASGGAAGELARDRGVAAATAMWATPLALAGIASLFTGIAFALARIRHSIRGRRDAFVAALPRVPSPTT